MTMLMSEFGVKLLKMLAIAVVKRVIFTNSLIDATIQDGGKRERSDVLHASSSLIKRNSKEKKYKIKKNRQKKNKNISPHVHHNTCLVSKYRELVLKFAL